MAGFRQIQRELSQLDYLNVDRQTNQEKTEKDHRHGPDPPLSADGCFLYVQATNGMAQFAHDAVTGSLSIVASYY